jgi:hypothetical protein
MAVTEAIESSTSLVMEGIKGIWETGTTKEARIHNVTKYKRKCWKQSAAIYGRELRIEGQSLQSIFRGRLL